MDYVADFETTTDPADCRVWAWAFCPVGFPTEVSVGTSLDDFMYEVEQRLGTWSFHNLAFDGEFIMIWLFQHGFEHTTEKLQTRTFHLVMSELGKVYKIEVCFERKGKHAMKRAVFLDSLKKLPMSVSRVASAFKAPMSKLHIDYSAPRAVGHVLTDEECEYVSADVGIISHALNVQHSQGLTAMTIGGDALTSYKEMIGKQRFNRLFPKLSLDWDADIRRAYKGGWTYANPDFQANADRPRFTVGMGSVYDVNSLYPDVMYHKLLPWGRPVAFGGKYEYDKDYPLYVQAFTAAFTIKPGMLPTVQVKRHPLFQPTEYVTDSVGAVELMMTNVDFELFVEHYDVTVFGWNGGYKFHGAHDLFKDYIDHWMEVKMHTTGGLRQIAKLMLNSLYGKFGKNPDVTGKIPVLLHDGSLGYKVGERELADPLYIPMAAFVTAWARDKTIRAAQEVKDRFCYADTDSLHLLGTDRPNLDVDPVKLGYWDNESTFMMGRYLRAKTYLECVVAEEGKPVRPYLSVRCAGMPENVKREVNFRNFEVGLTLGGKLVPSHVPGGVVLAERPFTIR